jgi:hypothetical protein
MNVRRVTFNLLLAGGLWLSGVAPALGQVTFESAGERALGMAGAFVAVADDATAAHWNPAGLAVGGPAGMTIGWHRFRFGNGDAPLTPGAGRREVSFTSLGTWPLGISYGTFKDSWLVEGVDGETEIRTLRVSQVGVTILQSVFPGLVVGSTVKFLRGGAAHGQASGATIEAALDAADDLDEDRENAVDLDVSVMASSDLLRVGLTVKNLRSSSFGEIPGIENRLPRQARVGLAVTPAPGVTLAMDFDLDTVGLVGGLRRMGAVGGEARLGSRIGVRSGVRWSLVGDRRPVGAAGLSVAVRQGMWLDGHYAQGHRDEDREFGVALRAGF